MFRLTDVLLVLALIYQLVIQAKGAPDITARDENPSCSKRTMFSIVWGCVSTTIICAWAAIHPNIGPREGPLKRALRRLELMFWTIVAPEILPSWALNQLLAAITVRDVYNEGKGYEMKRCGIWERVKGWYSWYEIKEAGPAWTMAHGHFLIMGGFHVVEPPEVQDRNIRPTEANTDTQAAPKSTPMVEATNISTEKGHKPSEKKPEGRVTVLTLEILKDLVKDPDFEIQTTEEEITDKSKGDALSKLIFILQSTWFILQCVGRRVQGLNLTHLELTTLALASLNGITFALWWDKPLGAQAIVRIHLNRKLTDSEREPQVPGRSARSEISNWISIAESVGTIRDAFRCQSKDNIFVVWLFQIPYAIIYLLLSPIILFSLAFFATLSDLLFGLFSFSPDDTHVPTFYVPNHRYHKRYHISLLLSLGVVFGGIHCSGWNFSFPTYKEQKLWRAASLAVTITPIATFVFVFIVVVIEIYPDFVAGLGVITLLLCALAYVSARLVLLGQALALLRHPPPTAFIAISWTKFYPHFL